jgi:hypothetical protein
VTESTPHQPQPPDFSTGPLPPVSAPPTGYPLPGSAPFPPPAPPSVSYPPPGSAYVPPPTPLPPGGYQPVPPDFGTVLPAPASTGLPTSVKAARIVLFVGAAISALMLAGAILMRVDSFAIGYVFGSTLPGWLGLVVAFRLHTGKRLWWVLALVVVGLWVLGALSALGNGDPRGITQLLLPVVALVTLLQPTATAFFAKKA